MYDIDSIWLAVDNDNGTVGLDPEDEHNGYRGYLLNLQLAQFRKGTTKLERGEQVQTVLLERDRGYRARVAAWADAEFARRVNEIPVRLPLDELRERIRKLKRVWAEPLHALLGVSTINRRERSHEPQDAHWHRYELFDNRLTKSRSKSRRAWLKTYRARRGPDSPQKLAEAKYYAKRKAARETAKAVKGAA